MLHNTGCSNNYSSRLEDKTSRTNLALLFGVLSTILIIWGYSEINCIIIYTSIIILSLLLILRCFKAKNFGLLLIFVYIFKYVYILRYPLFEGISFGPYTYRNDSVGYYNLSLTILPALVALYYSISIKPAYLIKRKILYNSNFIYIFGLICFVGSFIFGRTGMTIFESGGYGQEGTSNMSTIYEYGIIFFIASFIFSGESNRKKIFLYFLALLYIIKDLLYGGRVSSLQIIFAIWFLDFQYRNISLKYLMTIAFAGFIFFSAWGNFRADAKGNFSLFTRTNKEIKGYYSNDDGYVLYSGVRAVNLCHDGIIEGETRLLITINFLESIVLPTSSQNTKYDIRWFQSDTYGSGGGGFFSAFFYIYGSYLLVFLSSLFIGYFMTRMYNENSYYSFESIYSLFVCLSCPRWIGYNIVSLFKFCLLGALVIIVLKYITNKRT